MSELSPGDKFTTRSAQGRVRTFTVKDDGTLRAESRPIGFTFRAPQCLDLAPASVADGADHFCTKPTGHDGEHREGVHADGKDRRWPHG